MNRLPFQQQIRIIGLLTEGNAIRGIERLTGHHRDSIMHLGRRVGEACHRLHHARMRNLQPLCLQLDEMWSFIGEKQRHVTEQSPPEHGDCYLWLALDADRKAVIGYRAGKRTMEDAIIFCRDLRSRVINRPQITTDGFIAYVEAIEDAFGRDVDYAMLKKQMNGADGPVFGITKAVQIGNPDLEKVSTSYVERANLTVRMHLRRCARRTNAYSKKHGHHVAAIALHLAFYNFCRVHESLRVTPAVELGLTDHVWSIRELIEEAKAAPPIDPVPPPIEPTLRKDGKPVLHMVRGGRPNKIQ